MAADLKVVPGEPVFHGAVLIVRPAFDVADHLGIGRRFVGAQPDFAVVIAGGPERVVARLRGIAGSRGSGRPNCPRRHRAGRASGPSKPGSDCPDTGHRPCRVSTLSVTARIRVSPFLDQDVALAGSAANAEPVSDAKTSATTTKHNFLLMVLPPSKGVGMHMPATHRHSQKPHVVRARSVPAAGRVATPHERRNRCSSFGDIGCANRQVCVTSFLHTPFYPCVPSGIVEQPSTE